MNLSNKIVAEIPINELWNNGTQIDVKRTSYLNQDDLRRILKDKQVTFVVANVGESLKWIEPSDNFNFWKNDVKNNIADNFNNINLDSFPGNYAFIASKWIGENQDVIILLEKVH